MTLTETIEKKLDHQDGEFTISVKGRPDHPYFAFTIKGVNGTEPLNFYYGRGSGPDSGFDILRTSIIRQSKAALLAHKAQREQEGDDVVGPRERLLFRNTLVALDDLLTARQLEEKDRR